MQKRYLISLISLSMLGSLSLEQDFIKKKTKYINEQQDIELDAEIGLIGTDFYGLLIDVSKTAFLLVKESLQKVNRYANGEKSGLNKIQRTDLYLKKMKIKKEIERSIEEIKAMIQRLLSLINSLDSCEEKIQPE
jgi:hypothetical protein